MHAMADMPPANAIILDNFFPSTDKVILRRGNVEHATAGSAAVETLMEYIPPSGTARLFAASGSVIYDVTAAGAGTSVKTGLTSAYFQYTQIGTPAGHFILAANGEDALQLYDGTTWANSTITGGITLTDVAWLNVHQNRVWMGEKDSLKAWYLGTQAIAGAATGFDLNSVAKLGGYIVGMGTWTRDGGDGVDDVAVFITSEGEAIVYAGTDPSDTAAWGLVGVYRIGRPLNRRSIIKAGSDVVIATESGILPLSATLPEDASQLGLLALSKQIDKAFNDAVRLATGLSADWQVITYPRGPYLLVNVPRPSPEKAQQFIFNTITGAPCRFTGQDAKCWALLNDRLYFGQADGKVARADEGTSDQGQPIVGDGVPAFNYFGATGSEKAFKRIELVMESDGDPMETVDVLTDFSVDDPSPLRGPAPSTGSLWGVALWGAGIWGSSTPTVYKGWQSVTGHGRAATVRVRVNSNAARPAWAVTNWTYIPGGML